MAEEPIFLTPAEKMRHIRAVVNAAGDDPTQDPSLILAAYFSRLDTLRDEIAALEGKMMVRETPFESHAPLIGPLIVKFRTAWNWFSTKWYVLAILNQQNNYNQAVVKTMRETMITLESLARSIDYLQTELQALKDKNVTFDDNTPSQT